MAPQKIEQQREQAEMDYTIQPNDLLTLAVYTNGGERIIDPNRQSFQGGSPNGGGMPDAGYQVDVNGSAKLPLIGETKLQGLTIRQAEEMLEKEYEKFYQQAFVVLKFDNKRVIVLGAPGGQVIPLQNENIRLTEVLALAKGVTADGRASNIRVIRDDKVFIADLSTFEGYKKGNFLVQPGDIIYVEPVRRPFIEALRDYSPVITVVTSLATLIFIISLAN
ncbi:MAG TPA: polysaccharide biosynthesis/export family protein [Chryseosolibacter sp.]